MLEQTNLFVFFSLNQIFRTFDSVEGTHVNYVFLCHDSAIQAMLDGIRCSIGSEKLK